MHNTIDKSTELSVALLVGGNSGEREVSLMSGHEVEKALRARGYQVDVLDTAASDFCTRLIQGSYDIAFLALHGKGGENGCIQGFLETLEIPYTGSGVLASALAMDKSRAKTFYAAAGLPTPHSVRIQVNEAYDINELIGVVGEKSVAKPSTEGSALGVTIVHNKEELEPAIQKAMQLDDTVLVERFIEGTEITVAVLGNDEPKALPIVEIVPHAEFYDFEAKYSAGASDHIIPARISKEAAESAQRIAVAAHKALGCSGFSRSDFIVDQFDTCWILETNTIPGMTPTSLFPDAARHMGMSFEELCETLIDLALQTSSQPAHADA